MNATTLKRTIRWILFVILVSLGLVRLSGGLKDGVAHGIVFGAGVLLLAFFSTQYDPTNNKVPDPGSMTGVQKVDLINGLAGAVACVVAAALAVFA